MPALAKLSGLLAPLELSMQEGNMLVELTDTLAQHNLAQCNTVLMTKDGLADSRAWKELRRKDSVHVYKERPRSRSMPMTPSLLLLGSVKGNLDDIMYGIVAPTEQSMKIQSNCTQDGIIDRKVLHEIVRPSVADPFRHVSVKWSLYTDSEPRDYVCVEATGVITTQRGERVGFHLSHSVAFSQIRSFEESHNVERGNRSICSLYRQKAPGVVDCYVRGFFDFRNSENELLTNIALHAIANQWFSFSRQIDFAHMKKLVWRMRRSSGETSDLAAMAAAAVAEQRKRKETLGGDLSCRVCQKTFGMLDRKTTCKSCEKPVCPRCRVKKLVCVLAPDQRTLLEKKRTFCLPCIAEVATSNARAIAQDELLFQGESEEDSEDEMAAGMSRQNFSWRSSNTSYRSCV